MVARGTGVNRTDNNRAACVRSQLTCSPSVSFHLTVTRKSTNSDLVLLFHQHLDTDIFFLRGVGLSPIDACRRISTRIRTLTNTARSKLFRSFVNRQTLYWNPWIVKISCNVKRYCRVVRLFTSWIFKLLNKIYDKNFMNILLKRFCYCSVNCLSARWNFWIVEIRVNVTVATV